MRKNWEQIWKILEALLIMGAELGGVVLVLYGLWMVWRPLAVIAAGVLLVLFGGAVYAETQRGEQEDSGK